MKQIHFECGRPPGAPLNPVGLESGGQGNNGTSTLCCAVKNYLNQPGLIVSLPSKIMQVFQNKLMATLILRDYLAA